jgi:hypothetical protein
MVEQLFEIFYLRFFISIFHFPFSIFHFSFVICHFRNLLGKFLILDWTNEK